MNKWRQFLLWIDAKFVLNRRCLTYLIQNKTTRAYFYQDGWTHVSSLAEEYSDVGRAMVACLRHELRDVELVLRFGAEVGGNCSLRLSLPDTLVCG